MYKIKYTKQAKKDIENIFDYIINKLNNRTAANNLKNKIKKEEKNIQMFPYGNAEISFVKPLEHKYRKSIVNNYELFYRIDDANKTIIITRILHNKQNIKSKLSKIFNV